ncbi:hypothetical protein O7631_04290 [Micromonospora sp. WMMD967]|uniref:hypothetical protein n=1 Tax=Micromonospora sp. WMMD967 TaxID=3016101 RepID=UPI0024173657|nr:hypothetical protein [Micromonospora sp. WMMD967]MDG4835733.1 hypothetical protein [Micromonospora sp. WMMD967]
MLGRVGSEYVLLNQLPPTRLAWLALLLATTPVLTMLAPVLTMIASATALAGITITDVRQIRRVAWRTNPCLLHEGRPLRTALPRPFAHTVMGRSGATEGDLR